MKVWEVEPKPLRQTVQSFFSFCLEYISHHTLWNLSTVEDPHVLCSYDLKYYPSNGEFTHRLNLACLSSYSSPLSIQFWVRSLTSSLSVSSFELSSWRLRIHSSNYGQVHLHLHLFFLLMIVSYEVLHIEGRNLELQKKLYAKCLRPDEESITTREAREIEASNSHPDHSRQTMDWGDFWFSLLHTTLQMESLLIGWRPQLNKRSS